MDEVISLISVTTMEHLAELDLAVLCNCILFMRECAQDAEAKREA